MDFLKDQDAVIQILHFMEENGRAVQAWVPVRLLPAPSRTSHEVQR